MPLVEQILALVDDLIPIGVLVLRAVVFLWWLRNEDEP
jgi:hypothetical protein